MYPSRSGQTPLFDTDDLLLYAASPFAFWMERYHLEKGGSGVSPDPGSKPPPSLLASQAALQECLPGSVRVVPWTAPESERRLATLEAVRGGVDWILDAQLANGRFSTPCNLLRREAGPEGKESYVPCVTQALPARTARVHLSLLADLLIDVLGDPPRDLLVIRKGQVEELWASATWLPLFQAFRDRFLRDQAAFDPSLPPDPGQSLDYGRWTQRALAQLQQSRARSKPAAGSGGESSAVTASTQEGDAREPGVAAAHDAPGSAKGHPLDTPGFNVLQTRRRRREHGERTASPAFSSTLNTRDSVDD